MSERSRRSVLALGLGVVSAIAGCSGGSSGDGTATPTGTRSEDTTASEDTTSDTTTDDGTTPSGTTDPAEVESYAFDHARELHRLQAGFPQRDVASYYLAVLRNDRHAEEFPVRWFDDQRSARFLSETDYSRSVLVVLQDRRGSSHPDLQLRKAGHEGRRVTVEAEYPGKGATADITTDTLLVRIPTKEPIRGARATVHPMTGDPVRLGTANLYDVVPRFADAGDLVVRNRDCTDHSLPVTVTYRGDLFFRKTLEVGPATTRQVPDVATHAGEWTVSVDGVTPTAETWNLADTPPGDLLVTVAGDGDVSLSHPSEDLEVVDPTACETDGLPYESSTPAENLDTPVGLRVLDRATPASRLTVTVRDGDARVFSRTFDTVRGEDKIHRAGLLAKKTDYTVTVTAEDGRSVTETVTLAEGSRKLVVRVTDDGELTVALR